MGEDKSALSTDVHIICGPPGSGKTTKEKDRALVKRWFSVSKSTEKGIPMNETVNQETNGTAAAQQENRTFTQDEVNAIVADRLTRERAKYADYDDLKGKAGRADEADSRAAALQQQLDAMKADNDRREMKQRVSAATGVPAALLTGETEEACTAQAQEILKFSAPAYPNVRDGGTAGAIGNIPASQRHTTDLSPAFSRGNKHTPKKPQFFSY